MAIAATAAIAPGAPNPAARPVAATADRSLDAVPSTLPTTAPINQLPLWRGFNLLDFFLSENARDFQESDFLMIADWGFNFVRIPMSYLCWSSATDWSEVREKPLQNLDRAVSFGQAHGIHVNLNLHRLPGYCVNPPAEPSSIWTDDAALDAAALQWTALAKRYAHVPAPQLSFDLINEPADIKPAVYLKVVKRLVDAIRTESPDRMIIADGLKWGRAPVPELADLKIGQSTRGYMPLQVSHYKASWMHDSDKWDVPTWPVLVGKETWDRSRLMREQQPWIDLQREHNVGVHVGEWGAYNRTPHAVALAWMQACLELWKANGWGWSLWNLPGSFGVLNSGRADVAYESFKGHKLDRAMLELLRAH